MKASCAAVVAVTACVLIAGCESMDRYDSAFTDSRRPGSTSPPPVAPEVKAGWANDNAQYNYYLSYLDRFTSTAALKVDVSGRLLFAALDEANRPIAHCAVRVLAPDGEMLAERHTYADGRCMFFPRERGAAPAGPILVEARFGQQVLRREIDLREPQPAVRELRFAGPRPKVEQAPLDIAFVLDTTASMADELDKLKKTLDAVRYQISQLSPKPDVRFAMVLYRDRGEAYVTKTFPFTADAEQFAKDLSAAKAEAGGDTPEDVQAALLETTKLAWRPMAVKLAFLLGDAPPHLDYREETFTYADFMRWAAREGVKMTTIGASGLDPQGEYIYRQLAQYTMGLFVFLTYGEKGESKGDTPWTVSHHTGDNWETRNLDTILVRAVAAELSHLGEKPVEAPADYYEARPAEGVKDEAVLEDLFGQCARQLVDFSQVKIDGGTTLAVAPPTPEENCPEALAKALGDRLETALSRQKTFKIVEREQLGKLLREIDLATAFSWGAGAADGEATGAGPATAPAPRAGRQLIAKYLLLSKLRRTPSGYEMLLKMVRIETGEVASATMMKIDQRLLESKPG